MLKYLVGGRILLGCLDAKFLQHDKGRKSGCDLQYISQKLGNIDKYSQVDDLTDPIALTLMGRIGADTSHGHRSEPACFRDACAGHA